MESQFSFCFVQTVDLDRARAFTKKPSYIIQKYQHSKKEKQYTNKD